ncbi:MAG: RNA polymerase sigma factor [Candidatus Cyclobacteriaceae bacterium M3_2C_046]
MLKNINEEYIWDNFLSGDQKSFDLLYEMYFPRLYQYGMHLTENKDAVKDCIQALFIKFWSKRHQLKKIASIKNYFYKSFRNNLLKDVQGGPSLVQLDEYLIENYQHTTEKSLEEVFIHQQQQHEVQKLLKQAFSNLTTRQREAIFLRFYEDMSYQDIAQLMSFKDPKYARTLIYRAIESLREILEKRTVA